MAIQWKPGVFSFLWYKKFGNFLTKNRNLAEFKLEKNSFIFFEK
jgi:hypothetical protein